MCIYILAIRHSLYTCLKVCQPCETIGSSFASLGIAKQGRVTLFRYWLVSAMAVPKRAGLRLSTSPSPRSMGRRASFARQRGAKAHALAAHGLNNALRALGMAGADARRVALLTQKAKHWEAAQVAFRAFPPLVRLGLVGLVAFVVAKAASSLALLAAAAAAFAFMQSRVAAPSADRFTPRRSRSQGQGEEEEEEAEQEGDGGARGPWGEAFAESSSWQGMRRAEGALAENEEEDWHPSGRISAVAAFREGYRRGVNDEESYSEGGPLAFDGSGFSPTGERIIISEHKEARSGTRGGRGLDGAARAAADYGNRLFNRIKGDEGGPHAPFFPGSGS